MLEKEKEKYAVLSEPYEYKSDGKTILVSSFYNTQAKATAEENMLSRQTENSLSDRQDFVHLADKKVSGNKTINNFHICFADTTYYKNTIATCLTHSRNRPDIRCFGLSSYAAHTG
ncbi:MAG: hypothetical protein LUG66_08700 [Clostridiales bacterium]|nr:hypothetical protein [Clostridiales bacterium]